MNLNTHMVLAFAAGIVFFHNVGIALIMTIGAMIPDLDREYFFVAKDFLARHQFHRSLFHNFFFIAVLYFINPFLSLGALSHSLLDTFTSATDRGVELLFPLTRLVKDYKYNINGDPIDSSKKTIWWVEDPWSLLKKTTDTDLQEPTQKPWQRSYGPFRNSRIVDWGIFVAAILFIIIVGFGSGGSYFSVTGITPLIGLGLALCIGGLSSFYLIGRWYLKKFYGLLKLQLNEPEKVNLYAVSILVAGIAIFIIGGWLAKIPHLSLPNLTFWGYGAISLLAGFAVSYALLKLLKGRDLSI